MEYLYESNNSVVSEGATSDPKTNDCHEILTAYLCTKRLDYLAKLEKVKGNDNILSELKAIYDDIKKSNIVTGASDTDIESIILYNKKEEAFAQAISAAKAILEHHQKNESSLTEDEIKYPISETSEGGIEKVILTGKSWDETVQQFSGIKNLQKFDVESYGMKDFNSSDIILVTKQKSFLGVSLKKTGVNVSVKDPPLINRSFNETLPDKASESVNKALADCFNEILKKHDLIKSDDVIPAILKILPKMLTKNGGINSTYAEFISGSQVKEILAADQPEQALTKFIQDKCKNASGEIWRQLLSSKYGLMCTHNNRVEVRNIINPELSKADSKYKKSITAVLKDKKIAESIALQLFGIIFKADADHGLMNLKKYNFDFGLCTGKGAYSKKNGGELKIGKAEYESIETVTTVLQELRKAGKPVLEPKETGKNAIYVDKEDNTTVSLYYLLKLGSFPIADIIIRYKGVYTSAPTFLATMTKELKKKLLNTH